MHMRSMLLYLICLLYVICLCKCVLLPLKLSVDQSNRPYDLKKHLFCHAPRSSVIGSPRSSAYRDVCVQASTSRLPEPTPLTVYRAVPPVAPPLDSSMHAPIRVHGVRAHGQFCSPKMTLLYMVHDVHAHSQFCLPKMTLLYIQTLPLLPEEGSELDI
jgi:hypothetical protein